MKTSDLDYELPEGQIAQHSAHPRDSSRLFVFDTASGSESHFQFRDCIKLFRRGDLLVFNNSKVFRARLVATDDRGGEVEIFFLRPSLGGWECLGKPGKRLGVGSHINFTKTVTGRVTQRFENGRFILCVSRAGKTLTDKQVLAFANKHGEIPIPPYVGEKPKRFSDYQTVYAKLTGSVAAPTAGFHFTTRLLRALRAKGVRTAEVTLHVGIGTFQPIKVDTIEEHEMHHEWVEISGAAARAITSAKKNGRRVIAVGTTTVRAVESWAASGADAHTAWSSDVNLFLTPGKKFKIIDALITNFHLPRSTLLLLVSAFIAQKTGGDGLATLKKMYAEAIARGYRFYSFGDALLIT